jgi:hypothetical protein
VSRERDKAAAQYRLGHAPVRAFPGVVRMTAARYTDLARLAGPWLIEPRPVSCVAHETDGGEEKAVYVAVNHAGYACYAGQTRPRPMGTGAAWRRVDRHLREPVKAEEWAAFWVLPLRHDTPKAALDALEADVCARLGVPLRNMRWRRRAS